MATVCIIILGFLIGSFLKVYMGYIERSKCLMETKLHCTSDVSIGKKLSLTSIGTGIGFGMIYSQFGKSMEMIIGCTFVCFTMLLTVIDWKYMILPTFIIRWGIGVGVVEKLLQASLLENREILTEAFLGAVIGYLVFMGVFYGSWWLLKKEGLGYGDVRFMGMIGIYVGSQRIFRTILLASLLASLYGIVLLKIRGRSEPYPLGPFLSIGGLITFLWGSFTG